jgi:hypothetical protein
MKDTETKIIYSRKLALHLIEHECELIKIIEHPYKDGFNAWVFKNDQKLRDLMYEYSMRPIK